MQLCGLVHLKYWCKESKQWTIDGFISKHCLHGQFSWFSLFPCPAWFVHLFKSLISYFMLRFSFIRFHKRYSFKFIESLHLNAHVCIGCAYWFLKILLFKGLRFLGILFVRVKSEAGSAERWKRTERTVQMHYKYKIQKNMKYKYKTKTNFTIYSIFVWGGHLRKALSTIKFQLYKIVPLLLWTF